MTQLDICIALIAVKSPSTIEESQAVTMLIRIKKIIINVSKYRKGFVKLYLHLPHTCNHPL